MAEPSPIEEEAKQEPPVKSGSGQSELVFYPDPDFLLKINQNIRTNNQRLGPEEEPQEEEEELFL